MSLLVERGSQPQSVEGVRVHFNENLATDPVRAKCAPLLMSASATSMITSCQSACGPELDSVSSGDPFCCFADILL